MPRLRFSVAARTDLRGIAVYSRARWGSERALQYLTQLENACRQLETMPRLGRLFPGLEARYRGLHAGKHIIFYRETSAGIFIVRVLHERMLPSGYLAE